MQRKDLVIEFAKLFKRKKEAVGNPTMEQTLQSMGIIEMGKPIYIDGPLPLTIWAQKRYIYLNGKGFRYLRKQIANHDAEDRPLNLIPFAKAPNDLPAVFKNDGRIGYRYAIASYKDIYAFYLAIKEINQKYATITLEEDKTEDVRDYGVIGYNIPFEEPEWLKKLIPGKPKNNPAISKKGMYYFGEQNIHRERVQKAVELLKEIDAARWSRHFGVLDIAAGDKAVSFMIDPNVIVAHVAWSQHARTLIKMDGKAWIIDPWMSRTQIMKDPMFKNIQTIWNSRGIPIDILPKPDDQGREGSCTIISFARQLLITDIGHKAATQHPIPYEYAILAARLLRSRHAVQYTNMKINNDKRLSDWSFSDNIPGANKKNFLHDTIKSEEIIRIKNIEHASLPTVARQPRLLPCMDFENAKLLHHQRRVVEFVHDTNQRGIILFHSLGSGKTITSLALANCLRTLKSKIVIATPTSIQKQFEREVTRLQVPNATVITHHALGKKPELIDSNTILIIDEAHAFKNPKGVLTKGALQAAKSAYKVILCTATPIMNTVNDIAPLLSMVSGTDIPSVDLEESGIKCMFSYYQVPYDVKNFPSYTEYYKTFRMTDDFYKKYYEIQRNKIDPNTDVNEFTGKQLSQFYTGIRRAVNKIGESISTKIEWTINKTVACARSNKKVVIFSGYKTSGINIILDALKEKGIPTHRIDGEMTPTARARAVDEYNSGRAKVLLITLAGAEGLDLKGTRAMILVEPYWNLQKMGQIVGRVVRYRSHIDLPKEDRHVDIFYLVTKKPKKLHIDDRIRQSADEYIYRLGEWKDTDIYKAYNIIKKNSSEHCKIRRQKSMG